MKIVHYTSILGCAFLLVFSVPVFGATGRIVLPSDPAVNPHVIPGGTEITVKVDEDPGTQEWVVFEIVVDSSAMPDVWGFEWQIGVASDGLAFDAPTSEGLTNAMVNDLAWGPEYVFFGDSFGFDAVLSAKGIRAGDLSESMATYDPVGKSLGLFVIDVTDETAAQGLHTVQDPMSFLFDMNFNEEGLEIPPTEFVVVPEPGTLALLATGLVGLGVRRKR